MNLYGKKKEKIFCKLYLGKENRKKRVKIKIYIILNLRIFKIIFG